MNIKIKPFNDNDPFDCVTVNLKTGEVITDEQALVLDQLYPDTKNSIMVVAQNNDLYDTHRFEPWNPETEAKCWAEYQATRKS